MEREYQTIDLYDRTIGNLEGLPDVIKTKPATIREVSPLIGASATYIVQTYRHGDKGDTIFLECVTKDAGAIRLAIPAKVADAIARQRETLTGKSRSRAAKAQAQLRKERGHIPFVKKAG